MTKSYMCEYVDIMQALDFEELEEDQFNKVTIAAMLEERGHCDKCTLKDQCPWVF